MEALGEGQQINPIILFILFLWSVLWKGLALWKSAKYSQKNWFIAILVINSATVGILEIVYLFRFAKEKMTFNELKSLIRLGSKKE